MISGVGFNSDYLNASQSLPVLQTVCMKNVSARVDRFIPFSFVNKVKSSLEDKGYAVIIGASGSGKSEQLETFLQPEDVEIFNLYETFCEHYALTEKKEKQAVYDEYSFGSPGIKQAQLTWLKQNHDSILETLKQSPKPYILLDEIDFGVSFALSEDEDSALAEIVGIGGQLRAQGKQVIFIIHPIGSHSDLFWATLEQEIGCTKEEAARTQFFTSVEEVFLLSGSNLTSEEKREFIHFAQSSPTAYLPFLKKKQLSLADLKDKALQTSKLVIHFNKKYLRPEIWDLLKDIAAGKESLKGIHDEKTVQYLLDSGFVGMKNGLLVMPEFSADAIRSHNP
jgi:hypothetical protein